MDNLEIEKIVSVKTLNEENKNKVLIFTTKSPSSRVFVSMHCLCILYNNIIIQ